MNLSEFSNLFKLSGDIAKKLFDFFDMDENGAIDSFEFICVLAFLTKTDVDDRLKSVFQIVDPDNNGSCSFSELALLFELAFRLATPERVTEAEVKARIETLKRKYFIDEKKQVTLDQFSEIMLMDMELKKCLLDIGIFSKQEIEHQNHDNDIQLEISKFEFTNEETEQLIKEKQEIDLEKNINKGILVAFQEELEDAPQESEVNRLTESIVPENLKLQPNQGDAPNVGVKLEHVYGYRCHDMRNNIFLNPDGKIILHASQTGIQLDPVTREQKFIMQNTNDIVSIDSFEGTTATGEIAASPVLCLWNNQTMQIEAMYSDNLSGGISHIKFSADGSKLLVVTLDDQRTIYLFDVYSLKAGEKQSNPRLP